MASISLENVHKRFRNTHVVRGVDLVIPDRSFVTLVGPSGCGKSTTLNLIAGLEELSAGAIRFDGEVVHDLPPKERDVAMVFQSYALYPHKTVYENLAFPLRMGKRGPANSRSSHAAIDTAVREAAVLLGIEQLLDRKPGALSGGQRQRVALGRALVRRPRVFLLDEPLSNLDAALRVQMRAEIKKLHEQLGTTFVYVTHDQAEAMTLSDQVVVFNEGVVQQYAPPAEIYRRPASVFVARFLGSPPMNVLRARIEDDHLVCAAGKQRLQAPHLRHLPAGEVLIGARSEDVRISLTDPGPGSDGGLRGTIYVVELLGPETLVTVELSGGSSERLRLLCRADAAFAARPEEVVWLRFDPDRLHLFDPATHKRLPAADDRLP